MRANLKVLFVGEGVAEVIEKSGVAKYIILSSVFLTHLRLHCLRRYLQLQFAVAVLLVAR